ncbi:MFS transporter [Streptomyces phaeoluteigriseus]|uniref:MFS transporter n=1 Tax=Streptomyces phaeoluteigriseus TaxID=114686 RepID=A0ABY4Z5Z0_9ACTN|nr:MFS transporter [Streptomyces phaeoluteigriseus]USQ84473.1 MFS transporter [Streptomyces phaeoluteigriseus]
MGPTTAAPVAGRPGAGGGAGRWTPRQWGLLLVLAGNMLIDALEVSVAVVALPSIGGDLGADPASLHWVMSGFAVGFGAVILFGTRLVERLGRRRVYLAAVTVFAVASLAGALADATWLLIATRVVKGVCAALTAPTGLAIITSTFPEGPARDRAVSVYSLFGASGFSLGLVLSGLLTEASWRWTFAFPAPVAAVLLLVGLRLVPDQRGRGRADGGRPYELPTALGLPAALLALVYGIGNVPRHGWGAPGTLIGFALAAALGALVVARERRAAHPLLPLRVLARPALRRSAFGAAALNGSYLGLLFVLTFHLQTVLGWSPARTGLALLPAALPLTVSAAYSGRLVKRFGAHRLIAVGSLAPPLGYALYLRASVPTRYATDVLPTLLLLGLAFVLCFAALHMQALSAAPKGEPGSTSGVYQTAVQFGAALMLALVAALMSAHRPGPGASSADVLAGHHPALLLITAVGVAGLAVSVTGVLPRRTPEPGTS